VKLAGVEMCTYRKNNVVTYDCSHTGAIAREIVNHSATYRNFRRWLTKDEDNVWTQYGADKLTWPDLRSLVPDLKQLPSSIH
jgi:hypothetical protein